MNIDEMTVRRDRINRARIWLIPASISWIPMGIGTINGLAGKPTDAPHLLIPQEYRGMVWLLTGFTAFFLLVTDRRRSEGRTRKAAALLLIMPMVRFLSYLIAWIFGLANLRGFINITGSTSGYYTTIPWFVISWAILSQAVNWPYLLKNLDLKLRRKAGPDDVRPK